MTLSSTGLSVRSLQEILEEIEADQRTNISPALDQSSSSPLGHLNRIVARQIRKVEEAQAALYAAGDPDAAAGVQLDHLSAITGTYREGATFSTVPVTVNVDPGTYAVGTLVAQVTGDPTRLFANSTEVVNGGGGAADIAATFTAQETGPVAAPSGTLVISGPVSGWNGITQAVDATPGQNVQTDAELRAQRTEEVEAQGSTTVDAIRADLIREIEEIEEVIVLENETDAVDSNGLDPRTIEAIVYGPASPSADDNQAVADQIWASKGATAGTFGSTGPFTVTDSQGYAHDVFFTRVTVVAARADITLEYDANEYPGDTEAKEVIAAAALAALRVGDDLDWSKVVAWTLTVPGVERVTAAGAGLDSGGPYSGGTSLAITIRQLAQLSTGDINITSTTGDP